MKKLIVRIYEYQNIGMGYGDGGTFKYVRMDEDDFIRTKNIVNGNEFEKIKLSPKGLEYLKKIPGYNHNDMDFKFSSIAEYNKEIKELTDHIRSISLI